jgi:chromosome segregation ATPase
VKDLEARLDDAVFLAKRAEERVDDLEEELYEKDERIRDLEDRVAELEALLEDSVDATVNHDDRDEAVIEHLEPGEPVKISRLHKLYRRHTDIRADDTLKQRVRGLVAGPDFRIARAGEILYDPDGGEQR